jgi:hypothetical protein
MEHMLIVSAAIAYDDPETGEVICLVIHHSIYFKEVDNLLLCPMQMKVNDLRVGENPKFLIENPTDMMHAISFPTNDYIIPLFLQRVTSYFTCRKPTNMERDNCRRLELAYDMPEWNPYSRMYVQQEDSMMNSFGNMKDTYLRGPNRNVFAVDTVRHTSAALAARECDRAQALADQIL